ncbi:PAS domain S-box protein [bacterium]|nr:PAS domain S-box protein [bacterium]
MIRILIVEDETIFARDIKERLEILGYDVIGIAQSGDEALALVQKQIPHLILMDIHLIGNKDGVETAAIILNLMDVPIVYLSAFSDNITFNRALKTQPYGFIMKPVQDNELRIAIETALIKHEYNKKLKIAMNKYRRLFEFSNDAIFICTLQGDIIDINMRACEMLQYGKEELLVMKVHQLHTETEIEKSHRTLAAVKKSGAARFESKFKCRDGTIIDVEISAALIKEEKPIIQGVVRDITERIKTSNKLESMKNRLEEQVQKRTEEIKKANLSLQLFSQVIDQSPVLVYIMDHDGHIEYANPNFFEVTGYNAGSILGNSPLILKYDELSRALLGEKWTSIKMGFEWSGDLCIIKKRNTIVWLHTTISPIRDKSGKISNYVAIAEDITDRKRIDEALRSRTKELELFNKSMIDREIKVIEMKKEVNTLMLELGRKIKYPPIWENETS